MVQRKHEDKNLNNENSANENVSENGTNLIQLDFVKSALTNNPCMVIILKTYIMAPIHFLIFQNHQSHLYLQGEDKLYVNSAETLIKLFSDRSLKDDVFGETISISQTPAEGRQWLVIPVPSTYTATNWPIRVSITIRLL